jgi:hypothetical protein
MVFGGYNAQMRGNWAKALRNRMGIDVAYTCCADDGYKGMPDVLPKGVEVVLVVSGTCSHMVSERAKSLAWRAGVRCEVVSKHLNRTVLWLERMGYTPKEDKDMDTAQAHAPAAVAPAVLEVNHDDLSVESVAQHPLWLDWSQIRQLLPMNCATFNQLADAVVKRPEMRDDRLVPVDRAGKRFHRKLNVRVWTMDEVAEIERIAESRNLIKAKTDSQIVTDPAVTVPLVIEPPAPAVVDVALDGLIRAAEALVAARTGVLEAKVRELETERDALKSQLERIKSALGV